MPRNSGWIITSVAKVRDFPAIPPTCLVRSPKKIWIAAFRWRIAGFAASTWASTSALIASTVRASIRSSMMTPPSWRSTRTTSSADAPADTFLSSAMSVLPPSARRDTTGAGAVSLERVGARRRVRTEALLVGILAVVVRIREVTVGAGSGTGRRRRVCARVGIVDVRVPGERPAHLGAREQTRDDDVGLGVDEQGCRSATLGRRSGEDPRVVHQVTAPQPRAAELEDRVRDGVASEHGQRRVRRVHAEAVVTLVPVGEDQLR